MQILKWVLIVAAVLLAAGLGAGRLGLLRGSPPQDLGVREGRLKPPATTPNSVSSQAALYPGQPGHTDAQIAPLRYSDRPAAAMARLRALVEARRGAQVEKAGPDYLYATFTTPLLGFVDDVEFWLDPAGGVIQLRSASRLGQRDLGANRARIETLRSGFEPAP